MIGAQMKPAVAVIAVLTSLLAMAGCQSQPRVFLAQFLVFGTVVDVSIQGVDEKAANAAFGELQQDFQAMHRDWHAWEPGALVRINEAFAAGRTAAADPSILELIRRSQALEEATGGRFNAAIGAVIRLWGFHTSDYPIKGPPPAPDAIRALVDRQPSSLDIRIEGSTVSSSNPAVQLDFGGIAKGYAIDLACARLRELGIRDAVVNAGGDLRAIGDHGDRPWRIGIRDPGGGVLGSLETRPDEAVFTSGNYERFRQDETERYPHILDPRTGWPVRGLSSATVIAADGTSADAAATALLVAGPNNWAKVAQSLGLSQVMVVSDEGLVYVTPDMSERVELGEGIEAIVVETSAAQP
jgi:thiamine biosynthesis lipoprotein